MYSSHIDVVDDAITRRMAGMLYYIDAIGADSHGNIYTGEVQTGKRIQKFVPTNMPQWNR